jgi:hypothetical protein
MRASRLFGGFAAAIAALGIAVTPVLAAVSVVWERDLTANLYSKSYPYDDAFEPIVATNPFIGKQLAVAFEYTPTSGAGCGIVPGLRTSIDGGATWQNAARRPWSGSGRKPNWHASIAWGPGPTAGSARLYWADTTASDCTFTNHRLSIAYSDDRGATWSSLFVYTGAPATPGGGFPDITVDRNPNSPNYGTVYATVNWIPTSTSEPGMRVIASSDFGRHWAGVEVPPLPAAPNNPFRYRIGYRLTTAPDGTAYASFCQADRPNATGFAGRLAYGITRLHFDRGTQTLTAGAPVLATELAANTYTLTYDYAPGTHDRQRLNPCGTHGIDVDQSTGRVYLAVANYRTSVDAGVPRGVIRLGRSDDHGHTWNWQLLPALAAVNGRAQSAHKPTLVARGSTVFVGFHVLTDVALGTTYSSAATVGNAFVVSRDGGGSWGTPRLITPSRWHPDWLSMKRQGAGLRDRAELTAGGRVFYAYGDGRNAALKPSSAWGRCLIYGAMIDFG